MTAAALVTGGGRGLGRSIALALAEQGWSVAVTGRRQEDLDDTVEAIRVAGGQGLALRGDATDRRAVERAVAATQAQLGPIDLAVANAGRFATGGPLWESDPDDWWRDVEVNLRGVQLLLTAVLPAMVSRGSGRFVALGSGFGNTVADHGSAYGVSKAAVHRLVESVAAELAGTGVSAFTVSPGRARTDMTLDFPTGFTDAHPAFLEPPPGGWAPPEAVVRLIRSIAAGDVDALSGRFLHITTDLDLARAAATAPDRGTLRLIPWV